MARRLGMTALLLALSLGSLTASGQANENLAKQGWYADPEVHIFAGQYWIYPTSSLPSVGDTAEQGTFTKTQEELRGLPVIHKSYLFQTSLDAFSSPDLVHWTKHRHVLDVKNVAWAAYAVWAPTVIHLNGKYYLFFGANDIQKTDTFQGGIGMAVSDKPDGPFIDAIGKPLLGKFYNGGQPIDPMIFKDDDGSVYFYFGGQGHCNVAKLSPDLKRVIPFSDGSLYKEITPANYVEGPFIIKRKGVYYFMWSEGDWGDSTYGVAYARGGSPTGPFQREGMILTTDPEVANGPGHHSVLQVPETDEWYIVYHRHPLGTTGADQRVMAIDSMHFSADGRIEPVKITRDGPPSRPLPAGAKTP